jgi:hypothetical protein
MKTLRLIAAMLVLMLTVNIALEAQTTTTTTTTKKSIKKMFPHVSLAPFGGAIFPLPKILNQNFKPGATVGLDVGYRVNREVGLYAKFGYYFMSSKTTGAPIGAYLEATAGPRYFFTHPKLKSSLYFEGGVGAYNFRQNSYVSPGDTTGSVIAQINNTKAGINGGIGATLALSEAIDVLVNSKYHVIFTPNGSTSFVTVGGGLEFKFR